MVKAPLALAKKNESYNINADVVASRLATTTRRKLLLLTNIPGVLNKAGQLLPTLTARQIDELVADKRSPAACRPKLPARLTRPACTRYTHRRWPGAARHAVEILTDQAYGNDDLQSITQPASLSDDRALFRYPYPQTPLNPVSARAQNSAKPWPPCCKSRATSASTTAALAKRLQVVSEAALPATLPARRRCLRAAGLSIEQNRAQFGATDCGRRGCIRHINP